MLRSFWAIVQNGRIQLSGPIELPEGSKLLVTVLGEGEDPFWQEASQASLAAVWDNAEDDAYAALLGE